jgi:DNA-binding transcriptional LysR family regulator
MKLDGIAAFVAVAEAGSISEAARRLRLSKSVVSERLVELERSLGSTLLHRTVPIRLRQTPTTYRVIRGPSRDHLIGRT